MLENMREHWGCLKKGRRVLLGLYAGLYNFISLYNYPAASTFLNKVLPGFSRLFCGVVWRKREACPMTNLLQLIVGHVRVLRGAGAFWRSKSYEIAHTNKCIKAVCKIFPVFKSPVGRSMGNQIYIYFFFSCIRLNCGVRYSLKWGGVSQ